MKSARLSGDNVYLRQMREQDIDDGWLQWINDPAVTQHLWSPMPRGRDELRAYLESSRPPGVAMFAICETKSDRYIGNARLSAIDPVHRSAQFGWFIGFEGARGKGFGSEALILLLRFGFHELGLNRIWTTVWSENHASLVVHRRLGFENEGTLRDHVFKAGRHWDCVVFGMLRAEFDAVHGAPAAPESERASR